jgi:hypothetical protein
VSGSYVKTVSRYDAKQGVLYVKGSGRDTACDTQRAAALLHGWITATTAIPVPQARNQCRDAAGRHLRHDVRQELGPYLAQLTLERPRSGSMPGDRGRSLWYWTRRFDAAGQRRGSEIAATTESSCPRARAIVMWSM